MYRMQLSLTAIALAVAGGVRAADPELPKTFYNPSMVVQAKTAVDGTGKAVVAVHTVVDGEMVKVQRTVTKYVTEARTVNGKTENVMVPVTVTETIDEIKPKWAVHHLPLSGAGLKYTDVAGREIALPDLVKRLAEPTPVLLSINEAPDPFYLKTTKPDTLVIVVNEDVFYKGLQGKQADPVAKLPPPPPPPVLPPALPMPVQQPLPPLPPVVQPVQPLPPLPPVVQPLPKTDPVAEAPKTNPPLPKAEALPDDPPPESVIKSMLEVQWGPLGKTTRHIYNFKSIRIAAPMKEAITVIGQGSVYTGKVRYPVRVECDITVKFADGSSRQETKKQTFHFFRDEFKEWTFRFIQND